MCKGSLDTVFDRKEGMYREIVFQFGILVNYIRLAMMEMRITLARLLWQFDFELMHEQQGVPEHFHRSAASGPLELSVSDRRA